MNWLARIFGQRCPYCQRWRWSVMRRRQNTAYVDDELNYAKCCRECFERTQEHWADMWSDYYRDCF